MLGAAAFANAETVSATSPVFGVYNVNCPADSDTYIGIPTTRAPEFIGSVQSVLSASSKVVALGEPNWTANQFVYVKGTQSNHYYLKFTSGELEGAWYDIKSNDAYSVEVAIGATELAKVAVGDSFQIIPHWTMATLFPNGGGFTKATKIAANAGATMLYKNTAFGADGVVYPIGTNQASPCSYYYRERGDTVGWKNRNKEDANDEVVEPNAFFQAVQPEATSCAVSYSGVIPMCATSFELFTVQNGDDVPSQDVYLSVPAATDFKLSELTPCLIESGAFTPSTAISSSPVDSVYIYGNEKTGKNVTPDNTCFYRKRGTTSKWLDRNKEDADDIVIKGGTALVIMKKSTGTPVAFRCKFTPTYISK